MLKEWESFQGGIWEKEINVRDFIQKNYVPYDGDDTFLQDLHRQHRIYGSRLWT